MSGGTPANPGAGAAPVPCKITPDPSGQCEFQAGDMPVTIQLCEDTNRTPATSTRFYKVEMFVHNSMTPAPNQPSELTNTTCKLPSQPAGCYDVQITVLHTPGAVGYVYEACGNPAFQLCDIDTSNSPNTSFSLRVV